MYMLYIHDDVHAIHDDVHAAHDVNAVHPYHVRYWKIASLAVAHTSRLGAARLDSQGRAGHSGAGRERRRNWHIRDAS